MQLEALERSFHEAVLRTATAATSLADDDLRELAMAPAELFPGTAVNGRYRVVRLIGRGGMGLVYEVADELRQGLRLALKTIMGGRLSPDRVAMFKAEFETLAKLRHPNVAAVYDFGRIE